MFGYFFQIIDGKSFTANLLICRLVDYLPSRTFCLLVRFQNQGCIHRHNLDMHHDSFIITRDFFYRHAYSYSPVFFYHQYSYVQQERLFQNIAHFLTITFFIAVKGFLFRRSNEIFYGHGLFDHPHIFIATVFVTSNLLICIKTSFFSAADFFTVLHIFKARDFF